MTDIRKDFPILHKEKLVYFDSAATTLTPKCVVDKIKETYEVCSANVHRANHSLGYRATESYEKSREVVAQFLNCDPKEVVWTKGTTEALNFLSYTFGETLNKGDEILLTEMEHHSNILPWQVLAKRKSLHLKFIPVKDSGELDYEAFENLITEKTKLLSMVHISNTLGTVNPIEKYISKAHEHNIKVIIDAAQSVSFVPMDVKKWDCDFLCFSAHKIFGPFGVGVLYGKKELLDNLPPFQSGGSMVDQVNLKESTYLSSPHRFEAGTPAVAEVVAFQKALEYFQDLNVNKMSKQERALLIFLEEELKAIPKVKVLGDTASKSNLLSFVVEGIHHSDLGQILDEQGFAVRVGHHCTQPLMKRFEVSGTVRVSLSVYNTKEEVMTFIKALKKAIEILN